MVHAEGYALQPHHTSEILFKHVVAGIMATRTEEAIGKGHFLIVGHEIAWAINGFHGLFYLLGNNLVIARVEVFHPS